MSEAIRGLPSEFFLMDWIWKYFPVIYVIPFMFATSRFEEMTQVNEILRWLVLGAGCGLGVVAGKLQRARCVLGRFNFADWLILGFVALFFLSSQWSINPIYTFQRAVSILLLYGCTMWGFWSYADRFSEERLVTLMLRTIGVVMALNLLIGVILFPQELLQNRFQGFFYNPNNIGILVALVLPLSVGRWFRTRNRWDLATAAVFAANLAACGTRSAMLGAILAFVLMLLPLFARRPGWSIGIAAAAVTGALAVSQTSFYEERILREESIETASRRTYFWDMGVKYTNNRPWLGHGFGTDTGIHEHYGVILAEKGLRGHGVMSAYHGMAVQLGRPAAYLFFGLLWGGVMWCMVVHWHDYRIVTYGAVLASGLVLCIFESSIYSAGNNFSYVFWVVFMLMIRRVHYRIHHIRMSRRGALARRAPRRRRRVRRGGRRDLPTGVLSEF